MTQRKKPTRSTWGSVREKSPGVYEIRYTIADASGERHQKSETLRGTRSQADSRIASLRVKYEGTGAPDELTVEAYWYGWFEPGLVEPTYAPMTISGYRSNYRCHIGPVFGDRVMTSITPREIQHWIDSMTQGAARHSKATLSAIYGQACGVDRLIDFNVMAMARYRMPRRTEANTGRAIDSGVYTRDEAEAVLDACRGEFWEPAYILSCFGGCRREEAVGCRPSEDLETVDTPDGPFVVYSVSRGVQRVDGQVIVVPTKNETSERVAVIPPPYSLRLLELVEDNDGWIVGNGTGGPVDPEIMAKAWRRWFQNKPYRGIPWMNLRNTYATIMHAAGYDIETISKLMGHASIATTARHYDRPDASTLVGILRRGA